MKARFDGTCKVCNLVIKAGKHEIIKDENGKWIHINCHGKKDELQ